MFYHSRIGCLLEESGMAVAGLLKALLSPPCSRQPPAIRPDKDSEVGTPTSCTRASDSDEDADDEERGET